MFYIKIGFRNIFKNLRRSRLTILAIVIGILACMMTEGFFNWQMTGLRESTINGIGHFQLYQKGFNQYGDEKPFDYLIPEYQTVMAELQNLPELKSIAPRMSFGGIISSDTRSAVIGGMSGIGEKESNFGTFGSVTTGSGLGRNNPDGIIVGSGFAKRFKLNIGDSLTLMSGGVKGGGLNAQDFVVTGISHLGQQEADNYSAIAQLETIQKLTNTAGYAERILILLKNTEDTKKVEIKIAAICKKYNLEYKTWHETAVYYKSVKQMFDVVFMIISLIVIMIIIFTISNTIHMNIFERIREIGTMRAVGTTRNQLNFIFLSEGMLLGIIGATLGIACGYLLVGFIELAGGIYIPMRSNGLNGIVNGFKLFIRPDFSIILEFWLMIVFVSVVAAFGPSRKAGKIVVADALRWI